MNSISKYLEFLRNPEPNNASVDLCHGLLLLGLLVAAKPQKILEIGIGPGFCSEFLINGIHFNNIGKLTCIDNYHDLGGNLPESTIDDLRSRGTTVIAPIEEKDFVFSCEENSFDFLMSDGDHNHAGEWTDQIFKIMAPNAIMLFHDADNVEYPNLRNYQNRAIELSKPHMMFNKSSRGDERCARGMLLILNTK